MNITKYAVALALFACPVLASETFHKTPASSSTNAFETQENRLLKARNAMASISNITDVAYYNIFSYLDSKDIFSLSESDKSLNKTSKEWIKFFLYIFSPKLVISDSKFNRLMYLSIITIFPSIKSIKDSRRARKKFNLAKNNNYQNILNSSSM